MPLIASEFQRPKSSYRAASAVLARIRWAAALRTAGFVLPLMLTLAVVPRSAPAQGFPGGGGMGGGGMGGGRGRGGGRGGRNGGDASQRGPSSADVAKQFEELASLDRALNDVPNLDRSQKDSLKTIEAKYREIFKSYAIVARNKVDSARAAGGAPDMDELSSLRVAADSVRNGELVLARAVLTTDEQRAPFDRNVADIRAEQVNRGDETRRRRGSRGT